MDEDAIHAALARALMAGRIAAGTKLGEVKLAEIFDVTRERMRKVLHRLGHERMIKVERNRGAFAIDPDLGEARVVYEARRILEAGIVAHLSDHLGAADLDRLAAHLAAEDAAASRGDRVLSIRLSADFHTILAAMTGNAMIVRQMQELVSRTMMLVAFFEPEAASFCQCAEHRSVFRALAARERGKAIRAMTTHLSLVETRLRPRLCEDASASLEDVLRAEMVRQHGENALPPLPPAEAIA